MKLSTFAQNLSALSTAVNEIREISGVPAVSVGILHQGNIVLKDNFGYRNVVAEEVPTSETIYSVGSLVKSFTAAALATLLDTEDGIEWTTPVENILHDFKPKDERLRGLLSIGDFLSHRSGLLGDMSIALQGDSEFLIPLNETIKAVNDLDTIAPFREEWNYNNWGYSVAGILIEKISKQKYAQYLLKTILEPLGLVHTTTQPTQTPGDNFAEAYTTLQDTSLHALERHYPFKDSISEAAGGLYSNVEDLLSWGKAVLQAERDPASSILKQIPILLSNQVPLDHNSRDYRFYGMGWIRTQLPGVVGLQGDNADLLDRDELPILGQDSPPKMTYYHQGSSIGYQSAIYLFPETKSVVVVLTNTQSLNDAADWIAQLYVSTLFNSRTADYVALARESRGRKLAKFDELKSSIDKIRSDNPGKAPQPPSAYTGRYHNEQGNFFIEIRERSANDESLELAFQGRDTQVYELRHLFRDTFEWALDYDTTARRARFPNWDPLYFEINFDVDDGSMTWAKYTDLRPNGLTLRKGPRTRSVMESTEQQVL